MRKYHQQCPWTLRVKLRGMSTPTDSRPRNILMHAVKMPEGNCESGHCRVHTLRDQGLRQVCLELRSLSSAEVEFLGRNVQDVREVDG